MKVHFCRSGGIVAWLIRLFTLSRYNHVAIQIGTVVFQAEGRNGVNATTMGGLRHRYGHIVTRRLAGTDDQAAARFLTGQIGKKYDYLAVFAIPFRANWNKRNRWFCSELVAAALTEAGWHYDFPASRVTPRDLVFALSHQPVKTIQRRRRFLMPESAPARRTL